MFAGSEQLPSLGQHSFYRLATQSHNVKANCSYCWPSLPRLQIKGRRVSISGVASVVERTLWFNFLTRALTRIQVLTLPLVLPVMNTPRFCAVTLLELQVSRSLLS